MGRRVRQERQKLPLGFRSVRDMLTSALGALGIAYETLVSKGERPTLLIVFAGLLGLPLVFREQAPPPEKQDKADQVGGDSDGDGPG